MIASSCFFAITKIITLKNEISVLKDEIITLKEMSDNLNKNNQFLQLVIQDVLNINRPNTYKWNNLFSKTVRQIYLEQGKLDPLTPLELVRKQDKWKYGLKEINRMEDYVTYMYLNNLWIIDNFKDYNRELLDFEINMFFSKFRFLYSDYIINSIFFERNPEEFIKGDAFQQTNNLVKYFNQHTLPKSFEKEYRNFYKSTNTSPSSFIKPFNE